MAATMPTEPLFDVDLTTSLLMAQLDLDDIDVLTADETTEEEGLSSEEFALRIQARYLQNMLQVIEDRRFALTFDQGLEANHPGFRNGSPAPPSPRTNPPLLHPIIDLLDDDDDDDDDDDNGLEYALRASIDLIDQSTVPSPLASPALSVIYDDDDDDDDRLLQMSFPLGAEEEEYMPVMSNAPQAAYEVPSRKYQIQCIICEDQFTEDSSLRAPCNHHYCGDCIANFVTTCTRDESVFPPKCCDQRIPSNSLIPFLSSEMQSLYDFKCREFAIRISDRIYCPTPDCSAFLGSSGSAASLILGEIHCYKCNSRVCVLCKQPAHPGDTCSENTVTKEVRALARTQGWQTCPDCSAIIELNHGCFHMTCPCSAQFCYLCAVHWKKCTCPQWEETQL